jgi:hypothetical protein
MLAAAIGQGRKMVDLKRGADRLDVHDCLGRTMQLRHALERCVPQGSAMTRSLTLASWSPGIQACEAHQVESCRSQIPGQD